MPYVIQDNTGTIIALCETAQTLQTVWVDDDHPALLRYKNAGEAGEQTQAALAQSDLELIRVIEDLTDLLIKKQVFTFTELPEFVQQKLGSRQKLRHDMVSLKSLLSDENDSGLL